ncbi:MAG: sulfate adenylyltransferase subunit CysD [Micropepsaceae bacterium]
MSALAPSRRMSHLDVLESEAIHIMREAAGERSKLALLFSGGKDSAVVLHLATKAFWPERLPFPLLHVDTGHNFPEVLEFRDATARRLGERLIVREVEGSILRGTVKLPRPDASRNGAQSVTLLEAVEEFGFDALIGGARRDEEKARAKERIFSHRDEFGAWNPKAQRAELWSLYNARINAGENMRVFPLSNWTERDVWAYIAREGIALPSIYFAHQRDVVRREGLLMPVTMLTPPRPGEQVEKLSVRFRTVGDITGTCPVASTAESVDEILAETEIAELSERGATRMDDRVNEAAMERRKREGYF